jgi:hypothetical protein
LLSQDLSCGSPGTPIRLWSSAMAASAALAARRIVF